MSTFDTLAAERSLTSAGIPPGHAEAIVRTVHVAVTEEVATQADVQVVRTELQTTKTELQAEIQTVRTELQAEIQTTKTELQAEIQTVRTELQAQINAVEQRVVIRMGAVSVVLTGILFAALKLTG